MNTRSLFCSEHAEYQNTFYESIVGSMLSYELPNSMGIHEIDFVSSTWKKGIVDTQCLNSLGHGLE